MKRDPRKSKDNKNERGSWGSGGIATWVEGIARKKVGKETMEIEARWIHECHRQKYIPTNIWVPIIECWKNRVLPIKPSLTTCVILKTHQACRRPEKSNRGNEVNSHSKFSPFWKAFPRSGFWGRNSSVHGAAMETTQQQSVLGLLHSPTYATPRVEYLFFYSNHFRRPQLLQVQTKV